MKPQIGVLLINIGTPDAPTPSAVGRYLKEFLMDPQVLNMPRWIRWILVHFLIVPRRSKISASQYQKIWSPEGSPLLKHSRELARNLQARLGEEYIVELGMRYGNPSIRDGLSRLKESAVQKIIACPLYPQYSLAATESARIAVEYWKKRISPEVYVKYLKSFYNSPLFLRAYAEMGMPFVEKDTFDRIIFSFHGLPESQVRQTECILGFCQFNGCCAEITQGNTHCYRAQCYETARGVASQLQIEPSQYEVAFQSRLTNRWIRPFTDELYRKLPTVGVKRLLVFCPSFVADCLETLEEVSVRGEAIFRSAGGEKVTLVPCLNAHPNWVDTLKSFIQEPSYHDRSA